MAYTALNTSDIEAGKPVKEELWQTVRDNQESFNTDIEALKQTSQVDIIDVKVTGKPEDYSAAELSARMPTYKSPVDLTITSIIITLLTASTSGTLEIEIDKSTDNGVNWTPQLSSSVDLTGTTVGSVSGAVVFASPALQDLAQNDLMRVRITGVQVDQGQFHLSIYGEVS